MIKRIQPFYYFSLECFYLYLLLFLFYTRIRELPPIGAFFAILAISNLFLFFALKQKQVSHVYPYLGGIIAGVLGYFLGFTPMSAILCTIFLYFRLVAFIKNSYLWTEERDKLFILFFCSSFIIMFLGAVYSYPFMNWIYGLLIVYVVLFTVGKFLQQIETNNSKRNITGITGLLALAVLLTGIFTMILPIIKLLITKVLAVIGILFSIVAYPFLKLFDGYDLHIPPKGEQNKGYFKIDKHKHADYTNHHTPAHPISPWVWIVLLIIIIIVCWIIIRKFKKVQKDITGKSLNIQLERSLVLAKKKSKLRFFRRPAPQEYIRKLIYQLQIYADKNEMGRFEQETVREWFNRVGFPINEEFLIAYENVRYGKSVLPRSEAAHFEGIIADLKRVIRERSKLKNETEEK